MLTTAITSGSPTLGAPRHEPDPPSRPVRVFGGGPVHP
jgi:hypothetical protein